MKCSVARVLKGASEATIKVIIKESDTINGKGTLQVCRHAQLEPEQGLRGNDVDPAQALQEAGGRPQIRKHKRGQKLLLSSAQEDDSFSNDRLHLQDYRRIHNERKPHVLHCYRIRESNALFLTSKERPHVLRFWLHSSGDFWVPPPLICIRHPHCHPFGPFRQGVPRLAPRFGGVPPPRDGLCRQFLTLCTLPAPIS